MDDTKVFCKAGGCMEPVLTEPRHWCQKHYDQILLAQNRDRNVLADTLNEEIFFAMSVATNGIPYKRVQEHVKNFLANKIGMLTPENQEFWYALYPEDRQ